MERKAGIRITKDLIADEDVEAVVIVTPTKFHTEVAVQAARAGKKIFAKNRSP